MNNNLLRLFYLNGNRSIVQLETIEISHPDFSRNYFLVRNSSQGLVAKLEDGSEQEFEFTPMVIREQQTKNDLDYSIQVTIEDVGLIIATELKNISANDGYSVKPKLVIRTYRSDDLDNMMFGPVELEIENLTTAKTGASFLAANRSFNLSSTGQSYTVQQFQGLIGI